MSKQAFYDELAALLAKHKVELFAADDGKAYGMHSPLIRVEFDNGVEYEHHYLDANPYVVRT